MSRWRYRPWQSATVAALAALLTACAAFAPLYYRAMQQSVSHLTLAQAPLVSSSVQLSQSVDPDDPDSGALLAPEQLDDQLTPRLSELLGDPVRSLSTTSTLLTTPGQSPVGELTWWDGECEHLTFTEGGCPEAAGEVAVSAADVQNFDLRVGQRVRTVGPGPDGAAQDYRLHVAGVFEQDAGDFWISHSLTGLSGTNLDGPTPVPQHDSWITSRATLGGGDWPSATTSSAGFLVDRDRTGVDELLALGDGVDELVQKTTAGGSRTVRVTSALPSLADGVRTQIDQSRVTVPLLMAQLCLLALVVLWLILLAIAEESRPEVAVARLRGRGRRGAWRLLLVEMLPVTLTAVVPGAVLALLASWFARSVMLPEGAPFELSWTFPAALLLAAVVLTVVPVLAAWSVAREPVDRLLRRVPPRGSGWGLGAVDAVVIAGTGAVVVVFATGGLDGPIALAAPGLLAITVGLVIAHLTMPTAANLGRRLLRGGRVRAAVSVLDAARSPATRRMIAIITLATALAVFSADALVIGQRNRTSAAEQEAGAALAMTVQTTDLGGLRAALAEADPDGQRVTPVVQVDPPASDATATLGVLPDAFPGIALFPGGAPDPEVWDRLRDSGADPIHVTGTELRVEVVESTLDSLLESGRAKEHDVVSLGVDLVLASGEKLETTLGLVSHRTPQARFRQRISCAEGCELTSVWLRGTPGSSMSGHLTLRNMVVGPAQESVPLGPADQWAPSSDSAGGVSVSSRSADELTLEVADTDLSRLSVQQAWLPTVLPALVAGPLPPGSSDKQFTLTGVDGESQAAAEVGTLERVPAAAPEVYVVDLDQLRRGGRLTPTAQVEAWFADDDPQLRAAVTAALDDRGIRVVKTRRLVEIRTSYDESVASWSLQLAALVGAAALLIALLVMLVSAVSGWRRRARDLAALRMSGMTTRATRRVAVAAQLPAVGVGVVAGAASGLAGAHLAMSTVPLFATAPEVSTLDLGTAWAAVAAAAVAAALVLLGGSVLIGRLLAARASLGRLRETL